MRKILLILLVFMGSFLFSENKISITANGNNIKTDIKLNSDEYIIQNDLLFLIVDSAEYDFVFSGYPNGINLENGNVKYTDELVLEGQILLKEGMKPGNYNINVILGFQTFNNDGEGHIPVEISEDILVKHQVFNYSILALIILVVVFVFLIFVIRRRKKA